jgi:hypothetical protein
MWHVYEIGHWFAIGGLPTLVMLLVDSIARNTNRGGRLSTIDLLIKTACFVKKVNKIFNIKEAYLN